MLYRTHCLWGEQKAAGDNILQFILFTGGGKWGPNREPTVEIQFVEPLWILVSFSRGDYFLFNCFPHITLFCRSIATLLSSSTRLCSLGAVNPQSSPSTAQELQSMSLGHAQGTTGQLWPSSRAQGQQEPQQQAVLRALCSAWYRQLEMLLRVSPQSVLSCNPAWTVCSPKQ